MDTLPSQSAEASHSTSIKIASSVDFYGNIRYTSSMDIDMDCMLFAGATDRDDYGILNIKVDGRWLSTRAHREIYKNTVGDFPEHLVIDHLCRNRRCINVDHLEPVTHAENMIRGEANNPPYTDSCNNGHLLKDVGYYVSGRGSKICKQCNRDRARKRYYLTKNKSIL